MDEQQTADMIKAVKGIAGSLRKLQTLPEYMEGLIQTIDVLFQPPPPGPHARNANGGLCRYRIGVKHSDGWGMGTLAFATQDEANAWLTKRQSEQSPDDLHEYIVVEENIPFAAEDYGSRE